MCDAGEILNSPYLSSQEAWCDTETGLTSAREALELQQILTVEESGESKRCVCFICICPGKHNCFVHRVECVWVSFRLISLVAVGE